MAIPPTEVTIRYEAAGRLSAAMALRELVIYAREHADADFTVYPADLDMAEHAGISVTGSDLDGVRAALADVPGLEEQT